MFYFKLQMNASQQENMLVMRLTTKGVYHLLRIVKKNARCLSIVIFGPLIPLTTTVLVIQQRLLKKFSMMIMKI